MFAMVNKVDTFHHRDLNTRRLSPLVANNVDDTTNALLEPRRDEEMYRGQGGAPTTTLLMLSAVNFPAEDDKTQDMPSYYFSSSTGSQPEGGRTSRDKFSFFEQNKKNMTTLEILDMVLDLLDEDMNNDFNSPEDDKNHQI